MKDALIKKIVYFVFVFVIFAIVVPVFSGETVNSKTCAVFVSNKNYFNNFLKTLDQLVDRGGYKGDICLIIGDDLVGSDLLKCQHMLKHKVIVKHFPEFQFNKKHYKIGNKSRIAKNRYFRCHKFHVFDTFFKEWDTVLYIDSGTKIFSDIQPILDLRKSNKIIAHSDAYPTFSLKLINQFRPEFSKYMSKLKEVYDLEIDYFQSTIMLFDTSIIREDTVDTLYRLAREYPHSTTYDQAFISIYYICIFPSWEPMKISNEQTNFYDYFPRESTSKPYIMLKRER